MRKWTLLIALLFAASAQASIVYYDNANPANDTFTDPVFSSGYDGIGDSITSLSPVLDATDALVQFYNDGAAGIFDATLQFFETGSPVGAQIATPFTVTRISAASNDYTNVDFRLGGLNLPAGVVFMVTISNVDEGVNLGLELYSGLPDVGSNTSGQAIFLQGATYSRQETGGGNPYFALSSSAPEPSTWLLAIAGIGATWWKSSRRQKA